MSISIEFDHAAQVFLNAIPEIHREFVHNDCCAWLACNAKHNGHTTAIARNDDVYRSLCYLDTDIAQARRNGYVVDRGYSIVIHNNGHRVVTMPVDSVDVAQIHVKAMRMVYPSLDYEIWRHDYTDHVSYPVPVNEIPTLPGKHLCMTSVGNFLVEREMVKGNQPGLNLKILPYGNRVHVCDVPGNWQFVPVFA